MMEVLPDCCIAFALLCVGPAGLGSWCCNFIFIDRKKRSKAIETIEHVGWIMAQENLRVWVYPEGTRNPEDTMLPFKRGVFHLAVETQVPIIPTVTSCRKATYSYKDKISNSKKMQNSVNKRELYRNWTIRILPRIETQGLGPKHVPEFSENVCKTMQGTWDEISSEVYWKRKVKECRLCMEGQDHSPICPALP